MNWNQRNVSDNNKSDFTKSQKQRKPTESRVGMKKRARNVINKWTYHTQYVGGSSGDDSGCIWPPADLLSVSFLVVFHKHKPPIRSLTLSLYPIAYEIRMQAANESKSFIPCGTSLGVLCKECNSNRGKLKYFHNFSFPYCLIMNACSSWCLFISMW